MLERAVGPQSAAAMVLFGVAVDGPRAAEIGLAWSCHPDDELLDAARALAAGATRAPVGLLDMVKATLREAPWQPDFEEPRSRPRCLARRGRSVKAGSRRGSTSRRRCSFSDSRTRRPARGHARATPPLSSRNGCDPRSTPWICRNRTAVPSSRSPSFSATRRLDALRGTIAASSRCSRSTSNAYCMIRTTPSGTYPLPPSASSTQYPT